MIHDDNDDRLLRAGPMLHKDMEVVASALTSSLVKCAESALSERSDHSDSDIDWKSDAMASVRMHSVSVHQND